MKTLFVFDNDGVLRDESVSYLRCVRETVAFFDKGIIASEKEMAKSMKQSNNDWERTYKILKQRGFNINFERVKERFQDLYLGRKRNFKGYINNEPWLADNSLLEKLSKKCPLAIVSGAPKEEIEYTLKKNKAFDYFGLIFGMFECKDKKDGLEKAINHFNSEETFFCDDRPSPIREMVKLSKSNEIHVYGIIPPNAPSGWEKILSDSGAKKVFQNVAEYCKFLLDCNS